jgi:hypothetical protein
MRGAIHIIVYSLTLQEQASGTIFILPYSDFREVSERSDTSLYLLLNSRVVREDKYISSLTSEE